MRMPVSCLWLMSILTTFLIAVTKLPCFRCFSVAMLFFTDLAPAAPPCLYPVTHPWPVLQACTQMPQADLCCSLAQSAIAKPQYAFFLIKTKTAGTSVLHNTSYALVRFWIIILADRLRGEEISILWNNFSPVAKHQNLRMSSLLQ